MNKSTQIGIGDVFGDRVVISEIYPYTTIINGKKRKYNRVDCKCTCGKIDGVRTYDLLKGSSLRCRSCNTTHTINNPKTLAKSSDRLRQINYTRSNRKALFLYCILSEASPTLRRIKVGVTENLNVRVSNLRFVNAFPISLLWFREDSGHLEKPMHEALHKLGLHSHGEWFTFSEKINLEEVFEEVKKEYDREMDERLISTPC
jgi:hypothetical protein